jgi:hypothetical protein
MPSDQTAAHSDDRRRHYRTRTVSTESHSHNHRAVRISLWCRTNPSPPTHASRYCASARPDGSSRTLASRIATLRLVAEGAGS